MTVCTPPSSSNMATLDRKILTSMFSPIGRCRFLEEKHFDACTALSGSGPAFACLVLEAMADGGVMMGLPRAEALELAAQTMQGAARMVLQSGSHPAAIKDSVTSEPRVWQDKFSLTEFYSTRRLYYRWIAHSGRRQSSQHHCTMHPNSDTTCKWTGWLHQRVGHQEVIMHYLLAVTRPSTCSPTQTTTAQSALRLG